MLIDAEAPEKRAPFGSGFSSVPDGRRMLLREATTEDVQRLRRVFARCSAESIYRRFHPPFPRYPRRSLISSSAPEGTCKAVGSWSPSKATRS